MTSAPVLHTADIVIPVSRAPIERGAVLIEDGMIVDVGPADLLAGRHATATRQSWPGVLTPGLVNAHTHLQYTSFAAVGAEPYDDYTAWSVRFVDEYERQAGVDWAASARRGIEHLLAAGVTAVGDVVTDVEARDALHDAGMPGVAYLELIGVDLDDWLGGQGNRLRTAVVDAPTTADTTVGVSPHAPYSVDLPALTAMAEFAAQLDARLHIHVAESDGEEEFYRSGTGSLADRVRSVATRRVAILEQGGVGLSAAELCRDVGLLGPTTHLAHGIYLGPDGRRIVADCGSLVALCPRSNVTVGVDPPPVADYLRERIPFAVGTDSLGSAPSLDLLADVADLRRLAIAGGYTDHDLDERLLWAATMGGATALGLDNRLGSLEVGKRGDLAVFDITNTIETSGGVDPIAAVVVGGAGRCIGTVVGGDIGFRG